MARDLKVQSYFRLRGFTFSLPRHVQSASGIQSHSLRMGGPVERTALRFHCIRLQRLTRSNGGKV
jgi:hypothetical protein